MAKPTPDQLRWPWALGAVIILAGSLRFAALDRQGLLFCDEGQLIVEARTCAKLWRHSTRALLARPKAEREKARRDLVETIGKCRIIFGKPAHNHALAAVLSTGWRADRAALVLSGAAGTGAVWAAYLLGAECFGPAAGLAGAILLALSPYHLLYSREGLSDSMTAFLWTACLVAWLKPGITWAVVSGALGGLCVASNYRDLFLPLLILACALKSPKRAGVWITAFALTVAAFEVPYHIWSAAAQTPVVFPQGTYFGQLRDLLSYHGAQGFGLAGFGAFGYYVARWEGLFSLAFLAVVLPFQFASWRGVNLAVNLGMLLPWLLFSAYWDNASRFFTLLLPLAAVVKGRWLMSGAGLLARRGNPGAAGALTAVMLALPLAPALKLIPRTTPYLEAAVFLSRSGAPKHVSTNGRVGLAYLGEDMCLPAPVSPSDLPDLRRRGIRYAVTDMQAMFGGYDRPEERFATSEWLASCCPAVREFPYGKLALSQFILEQDLGFASARQTLAYFERFGPKLKVIDLSRCRTPCNPAPQLPVL